MSRPFFRMGDPILIPVSQASAGTPFPITLPNNVQSFILYNPNPFFCRLRGRNASQPFVPVTRATGWPMEPLSAFGPFSTQSPVEVSVAAFVMPNRPLLDDNGVAFDFSETWVELIYGSGE